MVFVTKHRLTFAAVLDQLLEFYASPGDEHILVETLRTLYDHISVLYETQMNPFCSNRGQLLMSLRR